jgi:hypothetical protein
MFRRSDFRNARSVRKAIRNPEAMESVGKLRVDFICGKTNPVPMAKTKHDLQWAKAKYVCRLNTEDIRMAKELGLSPQSLTKISPAQVSLGNCPSKTGLASYTKNALDRKRPRRT